MEEYNDDLYLEELVSNFHERSIQWENTQSIGTLIEERNADL